MNEPLTLRTLVTRALGRHDASGRQLARLANGHGYRITFTTINAIAAGTYKSRPSGDTIRAIAWLAQVPVEDAFAAAGEPMPGPPFAAELPPGVDDLSLHSRKAAIEILRALVRAEKAGEHGGDTAATIPPGDDPGPQSNVRRLPTPPDDDDMSVDDETIAALDRNDDDELEAHQVDP